MKVKHWSKPASIAFSLLFIAILCFTLLPSPVQIGSLSFGGAEVAGATEMVQVLTTGTSWTITAAGVTQATVLVVAGGGGGGSGVNYAANGGGGGAGGVVYVATYTFSAAEIAAGHIHYTIGAGGAKDTIGTDSTFGDGTATSPITAKGGGKGGKHNVAGGDGGSGGGSGGHDDTNGHGAGTSGQGYAGGHYSSGGGGGGGADEEGSTDGINLGGDGHDYSAIFGTGFGVSGVVGGGGSGGNDIANKAGGDGGGGYGAVYTDASGGGPGTANTGGGGGGGASRTVNINGGAGGSGVIVIKYTATSPTVTTTDPVATLITTTTATLNGNITNLNGGGNATIRGFKYGLTLEADTYDIHEDGAYGTDAFSLSASAATHGLNPSDLTADLLYYVRAYATNPGGTSYGASVIFATRTPNASPLSQLSADASLSLASGGYTRGAEKFYSWQESTISSIQFSLQRNGTCTGNITANVRKVSDDSIIGEIGSIAASSVAQGAGFSYYTFSGTPVRVPTMQDIRITVEYSGGGGSNYITAQTYTGNAYATGVSSYYITGSWEMPESGDITWKNLTFTGALTITGCTPYEGQRGSSHALIITGTDFTGATPTFSGITLDSYSVDSDTQITANVSTTNGTGPLMGKLTVTGPSEVAELEDAFQAWTNVRILATDAWGIGFSQIPVATRFHGTYDRTYVAFVGPKSTDGTGDIYITYYDHDTSTWATENGRPKRWKLPTITCGADKLDATPSICVSNSGYIIVAYGFYDILTGYVVRSTNVEDPSAWGTPFALVSGGWYPALVKDSSNGDIYLFYLCSGTDMAVYGYRKTTNEGASWSGSDVVIIDFGDELHAMLAENVSYDAVANEALILLTYMYDVDAQWVTSHSYSVGNHVFNDSDSGNICMNYVCKSAHTSGATTEPGVGADWATKWDVLCPAGYRNQYYIRYKFSNGHILDAAGGYDSTTALTYANAISGSYKFLVWQGQTYPGMVGVDSASVPYVLWDEEYTVVPDTWRMRFSKFTGGAWAASTIVSTTSWTSASLVVTSSTSIEGFWVDINGDMAQYHYDGANWTYSRKILDASDEQNQDGNFDFLLTQVPTGINKFMFFAQFNFVDWSKSRFYVIDIFAPDISNTPSSHDFGVVQPLQTYWAKTNSITPPSFPLASGNCTGNVTNLSSFTLDYLTVVITDFSGGTSFNIVSTAPGANEVRVMIFESGAGNTTDGIYLTNAAQNWVASVTASESVLWELKLETGNRNTFAYGVYTATLTFTTDPAGDHEDVAITFTWGDRRRGIGIAPAFFY